MTLEFVGVKHMYKVQVQVQQEVWFCFDSVICNTKAQVPHVSQKGQAEKKNWGGENDHKVSHEYIMCRQAGGQCLICVC